MANFILKAENTSALAIVIRQAIGASPDEDIDVTTPEFNRPTSWNPAMQPPDSADGWQAVLRLPAQTLRDLGCRPFSLYTTTPPKGNVCRHGEAWYFAVEDHEPATHELWLFPAEWYAVIPPGFPLVDINGCLETFQPSITDDDRRFGLLAYGLMLPLESTHAE